MISGLPQVPDPRPQASASDALAAGLGLAAERTRSQGVPVPAMEGKLLRPLFALAMVPADQWNRLDDRFWSGALAIQMVHEASLLHDDVLDAADRRRGRRTLVASQGVGPALVLGDHYLTGSYRAAAASGSFEFLTRFVTAVERTVAGEVAQESAAGSPMTPDEYDTAITGKSGELFGAAGALGGSVGGLGDTESRQSLGRAFGNLYQRIDDLLDYCDTASTGKPAFQDYRQKKWSWVLGLAGIEGFDASEEQVTYALFGPRDTGPSAARYALEALRDRKRRILQEAGRLGASLETLDALLNQCVQVAEEAVRAQEAMLMPTRRAPSNVGVSEALTTRESEEAKVLRLAKNLGGPREWAEYFGEHARTFHLAARLFPPREAGLVAGLYAYCRFTDDLVDDPDDDPSIEALSVRLDIWRDLSLSTYDGDESGIALLDTVMAEARRKGVARLYPEALLDGVGMDLEPRAYQSWAELERYTFGVAGAVGGWMSQLFDVHEPDMLDRAHALGHGMQLTNIARDVGEDWDRGRVYLPAELLSAKGVSLESLREMTSGERPISDAYRATVSELMARADDYYEKAWPGIRALPAFFRRPVAAAASAYRGIHREIRRNGYDNLTQRAHTSTARKLLLAGVGLVDSRRAS